MAGVPNAIDRLRRPEHTGENRCLPCTAVNLAIAAVAGVALGVLWLPAAGAAAFALSVLAIYLRGYVVPGTPTLTRRYLPPRVLELFGKRPGRRPGAIDDPVDSHGPSAGETVGAPEAGEPVLVEDTTQFLFEAGVLEECADSDDVCLTDWFRAAWVDRIPAFLDSEAARVDRLAAMLDADPDALDVGEAGEVVLVERGGEPIGNWISRSAFAADLAAEAVLEEHVEGWSDIHVGQRSDMLSPLRGFLETCPLCAGDVALDRVTYDEEDPESCCFASEVYTARCADCGERLVEIEGVDADDGSDGPLDSPV